MRSSVRDVGGLPIAPEVVVDLYAKKAMRKERWP